MTDIITILRTPRIGQFAIFDFVATFIVAYLVAPYIYLTPYQSMFWSVILSIIVHKIFGIDTPLTRMFLGS